MTRYRLHFLNDDSEIVKAEDLEASEDLVAIKTVMAMLAETDVEIWQGQRLLARIEKGTSD